MNAFHAISKKVPVEGMELIDFYRFLNLEGYSCWQHISKSLGTIIRVQDLGHNLYVIETQNDHVCYVWQVVKRIPKECLTK